MEQAKLHPALAKILSEQIKIGYLDLTDEVFVPAGVDPEQWRRYNAEGLNPQGGSK